MTNRINLTAFNAPSKSLSYQDLLDIIAEIENKDRISKEDSAKLNWAKTELSYF